MNVEIEIGDVTHDVMVEVYNMQPGYRTVIVMMNDDEDNYVEAFVTNVSNDIHIMSHSVTFPNLDTAEEIVCIAMELTDGILGLEEGGREYECDSGYGSEEEEDGEPMDIPADW